MVKPFTAKDEGYQVRKNDFNYRSVFGSLNFLTNSTLPEAKFTVHQCTWFISDTNILHNQAVKHALK